MVRQQDVHLRIGASIREVREFLDDLRLLDLPRAMRLDEELRQWTYFSLSGCPDGLGLERRKLEIRESLLRGLSEPEDILAESNSLYNRCVRALDTLDDVQVLVQLALPLLPTTPYPQAKDQVLLADIRSRWNALDGLLAIAKRENERFLELIDEIDKAC